MSLSKSARASLKALWREFKRCSFKYPPLYHERFMPGTDLELYQHDVNGVCLVQYDVKDVCRSFREAYADKFGTGWEQWDGPDDVEFFGRFYGSPDGLEEFRIFAESARRLVCEMGVGDWDTDVLGYHGWLQLLENRAAQYPTPLLRRDEDIFMWDYDPDRDWDSDTVEMSQQVATPEGGGAPYPLHPWHIRLVHSVFTSSIAAIEQMVDEGVTFLIAEPWERRARLLKQNHEAEELQLEGKEVDGEKNRMAEPSNEVVGEENIRPPVLQFDFDGRFWELEFDTGNGIEKYTKFPNCAGFHLYRKLLSQPEKRLSLNDLGVAYEINRAEQKKGDDKQIRAAEKKIEEVKQEIIRTSNQVHLRELQDLRKTLEHNLASLVTNRKERRTWRSGHGRAVNKTGVSLLRARQKVELHMPKFAMYLKHKVKSDQGDYVYWP